MTASSSADPRYCAALERTIPSSEFSAEGLRRQLDDTVVDSTPAIPTQDKDDCTGSERIEDTVTVVSLKETHRVPSRLLAETDKDTGSEGPRLQVLGEVAKGGTSRVYAVRDRSLGRTIALKILRGAAAGTDVERRFVDEARVTAMLEHPNIMPVYDIGVTGQDRVFFTMKNIGGDTVGGLLRAAKKGREVPPEFATVGGKVRILLKVCDALEYAHSKGFIHQDIKPDNIMLGAYGEVLLLDWGCAIAVSNAAREAGRHIYGTPAYMSPEQARKKPADQRSDIYCLCATLFHMLTLHHPVWADDPEEFWEKKRKGVVEEIGEEECKRLPAPLLAITRKGMDPDPARRFQSVAELRTAFRDYQTHADSVALAEQATRRLDESSSPDYHLLATVTAQLEQALTMWPGNESARQTLVQARRTHTQLALDRGDLELAASIADNDRALNDLAERVALARSAESLRRRRARRMRYAAGALTILLMAAATYFAIDYYRQFGKWQLVYERDFTNGDTDMSELAFSHYVLDRDQEPIVPDSNGLWLPGSNMFWLRDVREHGDVRLEVVVEWPGRVDGMEFLIASRREQPRLFYWCPTGFSCQFGAWEGSINYISRNDRPRQPHAGNAVAAHLEPDRSYRLWFQRTGEKLSLHVDGRRVLEVVEPLPMAGNGLARIGVRSWTEIIVKSVSVWRLGSPSKQSPLATGDVLVRKNMPAEAAKEYLRIAADHDGTRLAAQALLRAYLISGTVPERPGIDREALRDSLYRKHGSSPVWQEVLEADAVQLWGPENYDRALAAAEQALDRDPDSRVALELLDFRPDSLPRPALRNLLALLGRTTRVARLSVHDMGIRDLSFLEGMQLSRLDCSENDIDDLSPLRGMPLRHLDISNNRVVSLEPLHGMPLRFLELKNNCVVDLSPLQGVPLRSLGMSANRISDLSPLEGMELTLLYCNHNRITDLSPLRGMPLEEFACGHNAVTDLSVLEGMPLFKLDCGINRITDLSPLRGLPLRLMIVDGNPIDSLEALRGMPLRELSAQGCRLTSLAPLAGMPLRELRVSDNRIASLQPLAGIQLHLLNIDLNRIESLEPLAGMPLARLLCRDNRISNLRPLTGMPLRRLGVTGNVLDDLAPFEKEKPENFWFDSTSRGSRYVEEILAGWEEAGDTVAVKHVRSLLALNRNDMDGLREFATPFVGHRYLYVPTEVTYGKAVELARAAGGYPATVTGPREFAFVQSLLPQRCGGWLGLVRSPSGDRWISGEPLTWNRFQNHSVAASNRPVFQMNVATALRCWFYRETENGVSGLLIEWGK